MKFDFLDIEKLRALPAPVRAQVAFGAAAIIAGTVGLIWVTTLNVRFTEAPLFAEVVEEKPEQAVVAESEDRQSWSEFTTAVRTQTATVIDAFKSVRIDLGDEDTYIEQEPEQAQEPIVVPPTAQEIASASSTGDTLLPPAYEAEPVPEHVKNGQ